MLNQIVDVFYIDYNGDSIRHLAPIIKYFRFLGIVPNYDFALKKILHRNVFLIMGILFCTANIYLIFQEYDVFANKGKTFIFKELLGMVLMAELLFYIFAVVYCWHNNQMWEDFFEEIFNIELLNLMNNVPKKVFFVFNQVFMLVMVQLLILGLMAMDYVIYRKLDINTSYIVFIPSWIFFHQQIYTNFLCSSILCHLRNILLDMNKALDNTKTAKTIQNCLDIYLKLLKAVHFFNILFGKHFLFLMTISSVQCLNMCYYQYIITNTAYYQSEETNVSLLVFVITVTLVK